MSASIAKKGILINKKINSRTIVTRGDVLNSVLLFFADIALCTLSFLWLIIWFYLYIATSLFFFQMAWWLYMEASFSPIVVSLSLILITVALLLILYSVDIILHAIVIMFIFFLKKH